MAEISGYSRITPELEAMAAACLANSQIDKNDYVRYDVKRGLRDLNGTGVLAGLTEISEIVSSKTVNGEKQPCEGELYYRGYRIEDLTRDIARDKRFGFEETAYLLMFGQLPTNRQLQEFNEQLAFYRSLPTNFVRDVILKAPSKDMMNTLARCVLTMASYDDRPDDISLANVVRQCVDLIAIFPLISVYGYQAYNYYKMAAACTSTPPGRTSPPPKTSSPCCGRTALTPRWKPTFWTCAWCFTPSTAAATTPPSPPMWSPAPAPILIAAWRPPWPA